MNNKLIIIGNWKMYVKVEEGIKLAREIAQNIEINDKIEVAVCPPFVLLPQTGETFSNSEIKLGSQDVFWEERGAYTGEISPLMLKELGCSFALVGHSERRKYRGETDEMVAKKAAACYRSGIVPIICVGETLDERESAETDNIITMQTTKALSEIQNKETNRLIVAYEPRWAIGTGKTVEPKEANRIAEMIRSIAEEAGNKKDSISILYGGSVNTDNCAEFCEIPSISGVLLGGASVKADSFIRIVKDAAGM